MVASTRGARNMQGRCMLCEVRGVLHCIMLLTSRVTVSASAVLRAGRADQADWSSAPGGKDSCKWFKQLNL